MKKFVIIVFCKIYGFVKEDFNAMGLLTILQSLNLLTIIGYYKALILKSRHIVLPRIYEIIIIVIIGGFNCLFFLKDNRYLSFYKEYQEDLSMSGPRGTWITGLYIAFTLTFLTGLIWAK
jgi:hypothetical protein